MRPFWDGGEIVGERPDRRVHKREDSSVGFLPIRLRYAPRRGANNPSRPGTVPPTYAEPADAGGYTALS